jgi:hypothetical protein
MDNMFEETIRNLNQLAEQSTASVSMEDDEEGYFDRECPSEECQFQFKILSDDWIATVKGKETHCPNCGHHADSDKWWTQEQLEYARQAALVRIASGITGAIQRDANQWNSRRSRNSFISMTLRVDCKPQQVQLPSAAAEPMRLKITCPQCDCHYAVVGAAYFCPACGHNAAEQVFFQSIKGISSSLDALNIVRAGIADRDTAENTARMLIENGLQNAVAAFQRCVEALYESFPSAPKARRNAFQNIVEGNQLWASVTGKSYGDHLAPNELDILKMSFQQRHLFAHTQGIVDQDYIAKSGDARYQPGQRLVIREESVRVALQAIEKLVNGMRLDAASMKSP